MKTIVQSLEVTNYFGKNLNYYFHNKEKFHTVFGFFLSFIINISCLAFLLSMGLELLKKQQPNVNNFSIFSSKATNFTLYKDFFYAIRLTDRYFQNLNDPSILQLRPMYRIQWADPGYREISEPLKISSCGNYKHMFEEYNITSEFDGNDLDSYTCFNGTESFSNVILGGKFNTDFYGFLDIQYKKCVNSTESKIVCKKPEEIERVIQGGWIQIQTVARYVNVYDYDNPVKHYTDGFYAQIDPQINKVLYTYYNEIEIKTDKGWIMEDTVSQSTINNEKMWLDVNSNKNDQTLCTINVISSFKKENIFRNYLKIQQLLANVGGVMKVLIIIGYTLSKEFDHKKLKTILVDTLFGFYEESVKTTQNQINDTQLNLRSHNICGNNNYINLNKFSSKKLIVNEVNDRKSSLKNNIQANQTTQNNINNNNKSNTIVNNNNQITTFNNQSPTKIMNNYIVSENLKKVNQYISNWTLFKFAFCKLCSKDIQAKEKLLNIAEVELMKYLDFIEVSKTLMDVSKMKLFFMSNEQRVLFDLTGKVKLSEQKIQELNEKYAPLRRNICFAISQIRESYEVVKNDQSNISRKILSYFEDENGKNFYSNNEN